MQEQFRVLVFTALLLVGFSVNPVQAVSDPHVTISVLPFLLDEESRPRPIDKPIEGTKTNITAFIGETEKGFAYLNLPTSVTSWSQFVAKFGNYTSDTPYIAPAVRAYFLNGGSKAYIVKIPDDSSISIIGNELPVSTPSGLASLQNVDEVSIVTVPGITDQTVTTALIEHCESQGDRIAIVDTPLNGYSTAFLTQTPTGYVHSLASTNGYASVYSPWYETNIELSNGSSVQVFIPPSGAIAGIYARVDNQYGVHRAPANEYILGALSLKYSYSTAEMSSLNQNNVNPLRTLPPNNALVWGARTTSTDPNLKYISVRRLTTFLKESVEEGTRWVMFEDNDHTLWQRVAERINDFLYENWAQGALAGSTPEQAYFARCDTTTMTQDDLDNGILICLVGFAPVRPAEFLIFELRQQMQ